MANLFGFQITRAPKDKGEQATFVLPEPEEGATVTAGFYSEFLDVEGQGKTCLLYTSPSPRDRQKSRMPSSA